MLMTRRNLLLTGASVTALYLFMPIFSGTPLDQEAFDYLVKQIHTCLRAESNNDQHYLFHYCRRQVGIPLSKSEWLDEIKVRQTVDRTLRVAFRSLQIAAQQRPYPFDAKPNGKLSIHGALAVLAHLPIAPDNYGNKEFVDALGRVAPHYLA